MVDVVTQRKEEQNCWYLCRRYSSYIHTKRDILLVTNQFIKSQINQNKNNKVWTENGLTEEILEKDQNFFLEVGEGETNLGCETHNHLQERENQGDRGKCGTFLLFKCITRKMSGMTEQLENLVLTNMLTLRPMNRAEGKGSISLQVRWVLLIALNYPQETGHLNLGSLLNGAILRNHCCLIYRQNYSSLNS